MKYIILLLILVTSSCSLAQGDNSFPYDTLGFPMEGLIKKPEAGNCYAFAYLPDVYETPDCKKYYVYRRKSVTSHAQAIYDTTIIEVELPPQLVRRKDIILPKGVTLIDPIYTEILEKEMIVKPRVQCIEKPNFDNFDYNPQYIHCFCFVEVPAEYENKIIRYEEIQAPQKIIANDTIELDSIEYSLYYEQKQEKKQVFRRHFAKITTGSSNYENIAEGESKLPKDAVLIQKACTSNWKKMQHSTDSDIYTIDDIKHIQKMLKEKGYYKGKINDYFNNSAQKALYKFQKDNKLNMGALDWQTFAAFGIEHSTIENW